jgi:hypothetical protein
LLINYGYDNVAKTDYGDPDLQRIRLGSTSFATLPPIVKLLSGRNVRRETRRFTRAAGINALSYIDVCGVVEIGEVRPGLELPICRVATYMSLSAPP